MPRLKTKLLLPLSILLSILANQATGVGIYKWTDEEGNIHYGDRPTQSAEKLKMHPKEKRDPGMDKRRDKRAQLLSVFEEDRNEKKTKKAETIKDKALRQENCISAKDDLKQYQSAGYLYKLDKEGNRHVLEDDEYANAIKQAEDAVDHSCE